MPPRRPDHRPHRHLTAAPSTDRAADVPPAVAPVRDARNGAAPATDVRPGADRPGTERPDPARPGDEPLMRVLVGSVLRQARIDQGRTLREVAEASQVSLPYLSEIERGRKEASSEVLAAVYHALGLRLVDLVGTLHSELRPAPARPGANGRARPTAGPNALLLAA